MRFEAFSLQTDYEPPRIENLPRASGKPALEFLARHNGWLAIISIIVVLISWTLIIDWGNLPAFLLPTPDAVWLKFTAMLRDGTLITHAAVTLYEV